MERRSIDLVDVLAFVRVVETGSFARAAERLSLSKPVLSRRVARLEEQLGARLLTRTSRGAQPTDIGQTYYCRAANILAELEAAQEVVAEAVTQVAGPIRMTAPLSFGIMHLAPALTDFAALHPKVDLDVEFEDRTVDLAGGGYDLAVRIGILADSSLVARRIAPVRKVVVASSDYLERRGRPAAPADLAGHDILHYAAEPWRFLVEGKWESVRGSVRLRSNNGELLRAAAQAGLGICVLPSFIAAPGIESRELEPVLLDFPLEEAGLHAVMPPGRAATARVRALVDFLVARFGPEPAWDPCWMAGHR
ncbi:LysR family transcriptional regulator [Sphingosinicella sp. CPCC 101087]|uniref:LysR family transcriptional regulator n=1 Tax=Sphingosinicella sp. CPCC 101087 TaxID=2497754 RepID=UPI00197D9574|nr:LysR family transcriptional regulator [Sphingosinicella sp. CPCC 101087]